MQEGTKQVDNKFKYEQWDVNNNSETRTYDQSGVSVASCRAYCHKRDDLGMMVIQVAISAYRHTCSKRASKFEILTFCKENKNFLVYIQMDNQTVLIYLISISKTKKNAKFYKFFKKIFCIKNYFKAGILLVL